MTRERLADIRARADMAAGFEFTAVEDPDCDEWACPLCDESGFVEGVEYEAKELSGSVIAYGIGDGLDLCEQWVKHGPSDTLDLLDTLEKMRTALRALLEEAEDKCALRDSTLELVAAALGEDR